MKPTFMLIYVRIPERLKAFFMSRKEGNPMASQHLQLDHSMKSPFQAGSRRRGAADVRR
jgi:hypothetical protein